MFNIVLFEPRIAPNTGNVMRLISNTGCHLHLVEPLGFSLDEKRLRRAGLDYIDMKNVTVHSGIDEFLTSFTGKGVYAFSTKAVQLYTDVDYRENDALLFGPETTGLPDEVMFDSRIAAQVTIPLSPRGRSLNLSNAVAVANYEAWRQLEFGRRN